MKSIEYYPETKQYFKNFLKPNEFSDNENLLKYYEQYEDNIKSFIERELSWDINIYYTRIVNKDPNFLEWFYIIENGMELYSSDEYEYNRMNTYELALNKAIQCAFKNIFQITI